jgi:SNF2 family DNA or RNA helicase
MADRETEGAPIVRGGILADEMGVGKTYETIGLLLNHPVARTLLLVPPALQHQWSEDLCKSGIAHRILGAPGRPRSGGAPGKKGEEGSWKVFAGRRLGLAVDLATYDRATHNILTLVAIPYDRMVCDEGHVLRNGAHTARFRALVEIDAPRRWLLTGTPVQNSVSDFYNLMKFLRMDGDLRGTTTLETIARTTILRRTVGDVRETVPTMPKKKPLHFVHPVDMPEGEEQRVFSALVRRFNHALEAHSSQFILLELYLRIRQFIAHPQIYVAAMKKKFGSGYGRDVWDGSASKAEAFESMLVEMEKKPTIIFTNFKMEMEVAEATLVKQGYKVWTIAGGMSDASRSAAISESKAAVEGGHRAVAILVQIVAGGAGLNLQHCERIIFLSSHWNPAVVDQAIARAYRMGQTERVEVHHLLLSDESEINLDRYMANLHGRKRAEALMVHDKLFCDSAISSETIEEELDGALAGALPGESAPRADPDDPT